MSDFIDIDSVVTTRVYLKRKLTEEEWETARENIYDLGDDIVDWNSEEIEHQDITIVNIIENFPDDTKVTNVL